ncbi:MAG: hypothetical protein ACE5ID_11740, partial [Acidobacteriota bacterium]
SRIRQAMVARTLDAARSRLENEGEASARFYLRSRTEMDPGLGSVLEKALGNGPPGQQERLRRLLENESPAGAH